MSAGKNMAAFLAAINDDRVYSVSDAGAITSVTWAEYEALPVDDPRLKRVRMTSAHAQRTANELRGLQDSQTVFRN